jgi:hypothetical protein
VTSRGPIRRAVVDDAAERIEEREPFFSLLRRATCLQAAQSDDEGRLTVAESDGAERML